MSLIKGIAANIDAKFLEDIERAFPEINCRWKPGDDLPTVALHTGHREVVDWIKHHARLSTTSL